ncbi:MAG: exo-alpha-sialidase, partial [Planctomycetes bacterium]|nr:exo-alpha-sialidase [Planctomycetota bacterium]
WTLLSDHLAMPHMAATGVSGLDLYAKGTDGVWRWLAVGQPTKFPVNQTALATGLPEGKREYLLYLPLYNGVSSVEIGVPEGAALAKAPPHGPGARKPIVFYGTSITQGGCASRTGMVHTAIVGRRLGYPVINLGFSGNGRMEPEMARLLAELDPSVYVLDCLPNMNGPMVTERVDPFVRILRDAHPETPILLVEDRSYSNALFLAPRREANRRSRTALRQVFRRLRADGVEGIHYLTGNRLLGDDEDNLATVDGSHPTDLGFLRQAEAFCAALRPILAGRGSSTPPVSYGEREWLRTKPDVIVYLPKGIGDGDNEHFQVFQAPKGDELLAIWTQSSVEGRGDNRIAFARSFDGRAWSDPEILAGRGPARGDERQASWAFPVVARSGRIYCFYTKELARIDERQASGAMGCLFSDDDGFTWTRGADLAVPKTRYDHPDPDVPPNWIVWQQPIRDRKGRWIVGYTRTSSTAAVPKPGKNWPDVDSRSAFIRFENLDEGPDPERLEIAWLPREGAGLEVPHAVYPQISVCQEPALVLLPDGRLFVCMRTMTGRIWYSVSADDGDSWRAPEVLRYRDGGPEVENPIAPSPIYALADGRYLLVFNNNGGRRGPYDQFRTTWRGNQLNHLRHPAYIAVGAFRPGAHQPIWFGEPKVILDTDGVTFGPKATASVAMYPSLTEWRGERILWYPDRKHFLLGKRLPDEGLRDMGPAAPAGAPIPGGDR